MSEKKSITCDSCHTELIVPMTNPAHYALQLSAIQVGYYAGGAITCLMVQPPIDSEKHFCGKVCLRNWVEATI